MFVRNAIKVLGLVLGLVLCGTMQTDYVWDIWDFGFISAGVGMLLLALFGR